MSGFANIRHIARYRRVEKEARLLLRALDNQNTRIVLSLNVRDAKERLRLVLRGENTR